MPFPSFLCPDRTGKILISKSGNVAKQAGDQRVLRARAEAQMRRAISLSKNLNLKDLASASHLFEESARLFKTAGLFDQAAQAYLHAGDLYFETSRYGRALAAYEQSFNIVEAPVEPRCIALSRTVHTYANIGKSTKSLRYLKQAQELCTNVSSPVVQANLAESQAETAFWTGDASKAATFLQNARNYFIEVQEKDGEASASLMLAHARLSENPAEAVRLAQEALRLWTSTGNQYGIAKARLSLSSFATRAGEFERAQCNCGEALPVFQHISDKDNEAAAWSMLAAISAQTGHTEDALKYYRLAKAGFASVHDDLGEADVIDGIAEALIAMRQYPQLLPLYEEKLRLAQRGQDSLLIASAWANKARAYQLHHDYARAESLYRTALAQYQSLKDLHGEGNVLMLLAGLQEEQARHEKILDLEQDHYAKAISFLKEARPLKEQMAETGDLAKIDYQLASIYLRTGLLEEALTSIERTIGIIESERLKIRDFDSRASYFAAVHQYYALYIQILMELHNRHPQENYVQRAFEASEKSKVRSLLDLLAATDRNSRCDELLKRELDSATPSQNESVTESRATAPLTLPQIQAALADDTVLLEYALDDQQSYAWVVTRDRIAPYDLPPAKHIEKLVKSFIGSLVPPEPRKDETVSEYQERIGRGRQTSRDAQELSRFLVGQLSLPSGKRVLVVADGILQHLPFAALPLSGKSGAGPALVAAHEIVVLPSASALAALRKKVEQRSSPASRAVVFADPVFTWNSPGAGNAPKVTTRSRVLYRASIDVHGTPYIDDLPGSRQEALTIEKILGKENVHLALKYNASRQSVLNEQLSGYRYIHFTTHGLLDAQHPEMSGLILSLFDSQGRPQDGYLRIGDIYNLKLSADLVVLSSCESAMGKDLQSEGIIGLPRAFLYAGAKSVIATLWKVDDDATAALMEIFYGRIKHGDPPSIALRRAQLGMVKNPRYSAPRYWAAFVLQGDYQ